MNYISTRDKSIKSSLSEAISCGLAPDGSLFVPEKFPKVNTEYFNPDFKQFAAHLLAPFFDDDPLSATLTQHCINAFNFPFPLKPLNKNTFILELFHGPTLSFKDFGARFVAECLNAISSDHKTTIMVATSGDTGSAVASAFYLKNNVNVIVLYPKGQISSRQEHQITCWGNNILALAVEGTFDDCQRLVKAAFNDSWWQHHVHLSSANSINIGRLLPQITYYAYISHQFYQEHHTAPGFIVPTGNLGHATACYWAKLLGFPIREIVLATNSNTVILDYIQTGKYKPRPSISTLANAMDVGDPSNFERLRYLFNTYEIFKKNVSAISANDYDIRATIKAVYVDYKTIICPHTATACFARSKLSAEPWIVVATADPSKFENIIEPIIGAKVPVTPQLQELLDRPAHVVEVTADLEEVRGVVLGYFEGGLKRW